MLCLAPAVGEPGVGCPLRGVVRQQARDQLRDFTDEPHQSHYRHGSPSFPESYPGMPLYPIPRGEGARVLVLCADGVIVDGGDFGIAQTGMVEGRKDILAIRHIEPVLHGA